MSTKSVKGRKKRKAARRRKQLIAGGIYVGIVTLGVGCMVLLSRLGSPAPVQEQWVVPEATVEIAAPAERSGPVAAGRVSDGSSALTLLPLSPTHAPTAVPTPTASPVPTAVPTATPSPVPTATPTPVPTATPAPTPRTLTLTAAGDCTLGGSVHQETYARFKKCLQQNGYNYFFSNVRHVFEADDLTIVNLEGPLTNVGRAREGTFVFKGDPDYVQILTGSSVELCNVANNHSRDFGTEGLEHTREILQGAGIGSCGYTQVYRSTINGIRVSALGYLEWEIDLKKIVEAVRQERPNCDLLIVNMHWGREKHYEPVPSQKKFGHAIIDAGADLILGTHPHVYGGVELYKGRYIVYSLGNFCFGGNTNPSDKRAMMFRQTFVVDPDGTVSDGGIDIIPCSVSSTPRTNDYRPTIMSMDDGLKLLNAVGKYSNITLEEAQWIPGSYAEQSGLVTLARSVDVSGEARS